MSTPVPSGDRQTHRVIDYEFFHKRMIAEIKMLATPIDLDDLIARGMLKKASGNWYWLLVPLHDLPNGFGRRIAAAASSPKGMKVRFWSATRAAQVARKLGI